MGPKHEQAAGALAPAGKLKDRVPDWVRRGYQSLGVLATTVYAPAGLVLLALSNIGRRQFAPLGPWVGLWGGFFLLLLAGCALGGDWSSLLLILGQALLGLTAATLLLAPRGDVARGLLAGLLILVVLGVASNWLSARSWQPFGGGVVTRAGVTLKGSVDTLAGGQGSGSEGSGGGGVVALRTWALQPGSGALQLAFDARLAGGSPDRDWFRSRPEVRLETLEENGERFTRAQFPLGNDPYIYRRADLGRALAGQRLRAWVELRAPAAESCGRLYLAEPGARHVHFQDICLDGRWRTFELEWLAPETAQMSSIDVNLNDFDGQIIDVRRVSLEVWEEAWRPLAPLAPTGVLIIADWPGRPAELVPHLRWLPDRQWQRYSLILRHESLQDAALLQVRALFGPALSVQIRDVSLVPLEAQAQHPTPLQPESRQALWFHHPNLLGHSIAVAGLVLLLNLKTGWTGLIGLLLILTGVWLTGSRGALLAVIIGSFWLLWLLFRPRMRLWAFAVIASLALVYFTTFGLEGLGRFQPLESDTVTSRPEIWQLAWQAVRDHPLGGLGQDGFIHYWQENYRGSSTETVYHAHNLWLALASHYGLPGLGGALWLSIGLLLLGWRWGRWRSLALVMPVFIMNFFDHTLFYPAVLFPLLLGINSLRDGAGDDNR